MISVTETQRVYVAQCLSSCLVSDWQPSLTDTTCL